jgi:hypothetical protein
MMVSMGLEEVLRGPANPQVCRHPGIFSWCGVFDVKAVRTVCVGFILICMET